MNFDDLDPATQALIVACQEYKARKFALISATVYMLAREEPKADIRAALKFLGLPPLPPGNFEKDPAWRRMWNR